jgi:hypothetical protein
MLSNISVEESTVFVNAGLLLARVDRSVNQP